MPDVKIRKGMDAPKIRQRSAAPKEAAGILRQQYMEKQAERQPGAKSPVQYATDKVESDGKRGAVLAADGTRRAVRKAKQRRERGEKPTDTEPRKERAPKTQQSAAQERAKVRSSQPKPPSTQELRRQKVVQDTVRARQEARRGIDAEIFRVDAAANTEAAGKLPSKLPYRSKSCADIPRTPPCFAEKPGNAEGKAARPRISGGRAPSKPAFALKERVAAERQLQTNTVTATQQVKRAAAHKLQRQMVRKNTENAKKVIKQAARLTVKTTKAVVGAVKSAVSSIAAIAGSGIVLVVVLVVIALIAAIVASPFGIFFSNESASSDTVPLSAAVAQVNFDFNARLEELQGADAYDDITVDGSTADWVEILAVFAAKVAGSEGADAADVATIDANRVDRLKAVFWDMNALTSEVETIDHPDSDPDDDTDDSWTEKILHITLTPKVAADMPTVYGFTTRQTDAMNELLTERAALMELVGNLTAFSADAADVVKRLPADLSPERREVVRVACSLVGKVTYFWGGKSLVLGWDNRWGTVQKVTADGNSTTGTYRPYGLDCSGFVDWVFYNATNGAYYPGHGGGATMQHSYCTAISWEDALPGDLVFYPGDEHVGIVGGRDADGNLLIVHCASSYNGTVVTGVSGFASIGRPLYYAE